MILVDANVFLRYLVEATTESARNQQRIATSILQTVYAGEIEATTTEVVLHEVCYVLTSRRQYGLPVATMIGMLRGILVWRGWVFPAGDLETYLRALDLWEVHPKLEFSDAVIAARCGRKRYELATFDRHFDAVPSVTLWHEDEPAAWP